ncbi:MAG: histidine phosphatase family protein [Oscillospiraceae bacterium]|nr:histidine phosphatase family protein [Oscillospiraceae bacterium]
MRSYKLHLIRHGLTEGNLLGQYLGSGTDSPLCASGIERLEMLREKFAYPWPEKLYVSPMKRTVQTAEIIYPDHDYTIVADLRECHFGEFEGRTFQELMVIDPNFAKWLDPNSGYQPEGGEASADFAERVVLALDQIFMDMMRNGIHEASAVTHGGVIVLLLSMLAFPRKNPGEWTTDNGCGFTISTTPEMWTRDRAVEVTQILPVGYDFSESQLNRFRKNKGPEDEE